MSNKLIKSLPQLVGIGTILFFAYKFDIPNKHLYMKILAGFFVLILLYLLLHYVSSRIEQKRYLESDFSKIDKMTGIEFEHYLKVQFEKLGYRVSLTPARGDYGADLILSKDGEKIAVQAKRHTQKVSNKAVQEVVAAIHHYKCNRGMVITNSVYTSNAIHLAKDCGIELWDRKKITEVFQIK